jgi:hypothetical protein
LINPSGSKPEQSVRSSEVNFEQSFYKEVQDLMDKQWKKALKSSGEDITRASMQRFN